MDRFFLAFLVMSFLAVSTAQAVQSGAVAKQEGPMLYKQYCATCHGLDGRGNGPTAPSLKKVPTDLTRLQQPGEPFPSQHVVYAITGEGDTIAAHGSREMPVWGRVFRHTNTAAPPLVVNSLVNYLKTIQVNH